MTRSPAPVLLVGLWSVGVTVGIQRGVWLAEQAVLGRELVWPYAAWPLVSVGNALLVLVPSLALALRSKHAGSRAAGWAWAWAAVALGVLGAVRAVRAGEVYLLLLAVAAIALNGRRTALRRWQGVWAAVAVAAMALLPWLCFGALGGPALTLLAGVAAAAVGVLSVRCLAPVADPDGWGPFGRVGRGLVAAVTLAVVAAGAAPAGAHLLMMIALPALGLAVVVVPGTASRALLVGAGAFGPLAFVAPDQLSPLLGEHDVGHWATLAAWCSLVAALAAGVAVACAGSRKGVPVVAGLAVLVAGAVHVVAGQPGLYGDRLFVIMREQADLTGLTAITDRDERVRTTYRRLVGTAVRGQADLVRMLDRYRVRHTSYYLVNAIEVEGGPLVRALLAGRTDVDRVLTSPRPRPLPEPAPVRRGDLRRVAGPTWNIAMIGADRVWQELGVTGRGIVVGVSDTGVDGTHPALRDGFRGGGDSWYDPWAGTRSPTDQVFHGTHVAGTAVGRTGGGVAPGALWAGCVTGNRNLGNPAGFVGCLQYMLAPFPPGGDPLRDGRPERAAHVLNNSWHCTPLDGCDPGALAPATAALRAAGLFFVTSAGNTGPRCASIVNAPARYGEVLTVGGVDRTGQAAVFAARGPRGATGTPARGGPPGTPDVAAPAVGVPSAMPGGGYGTVDGTSMAVPHVSGVVALMWSANPRLIGDVERTERLLRQSARPARGARTADPEGCGAWSSWGAGVVDAYAATRAALSLDARP